MASRLTINVSSGSFTLSSSKATTKSRLAVASPAGQDKDFVGDMVYSSLLSVDAGSTTMFTLVFTASGNGDTSMMMFETPLVESSGAVFEDPSKVTTEGVRAEPLTRMRWMRFGVISFQLPPDFTCPLSIMLHPAATPLSSDVDWVFNRLTLAPVKTTK